MSTADPQTPPTRSSTGLPAPVRLLGLAGILPQLACLALALTSDGPLAAQAGLAYAAVILSFLGGLWWMAALLTGGRASTPYVLAVLPSLIGWGALLLPTGGLVLVAVCLLVSPLVDRYLSRSIAMPNGWLGLRVQMATGLGLSTLALALVTA